MRVLLLGGSGRFGPVVARYLACSEVVSEIGLAGRDENTLKPRAIEVGGKAHTVQVDIRDESRLASVATKYDIVVSTAGPEWNVLLPALRASIEAGVHYCDIGADMQTTEKQLELDSAAKERKVTAVVGIGLDPGIDSLLAVHASRKFDRVEAIQIQVHLALPDEMLGEAVDLLHKSGRLDASWLIAIRNISGPIRVFRGESFLDVNPLVDSVDITTPEGVTMRGHPIAFPEVITIPRYLPGVQEVSGAMAITPSSFSDLLYDHTQRVSRGELTVEDATRSFLGTIGGDRERWLKEVASGWNSWLVVTGWKNGKKGRYTCLPARIGFTSVPLAVAALRILRGEVSAFGVMPPEACFEPMPFFEEVAQYAGPEDREKPLFIESMKWLP